MSLAIWARSFKWEWCRNHPKVWSGGGFLNILGGDNLRDKFFACKIFCYNELFKTASMTPHRSAPGSPSEASELDFTMLKTLKNVLMFIARNMASNRTCSDRPLPTCKTSIVLTATIFTFAKANT